MKHYKILYHLRDKNGILEYHYMNGFGRGYSLDEAEVLKAHLESQGYENVEIVDLHMED